MLQPIAAVCNGTISTPTDSGRSACCRVIFATYTSLCPSLILPHTDKPTRTSSQFSQGCLDNRRPGNCFLLTSPVFVQKLPSEVPQSSIAHAVQSAQISTIPNLRSILRDLLGQPEPYKECSTTTPRFPKVMGTVYSHTRALELFVTSHPLTLVHHGTS